MSQVESSAIDQIIRIGESTIRLTGSGAKNFAAFLLAYLKEGKFKGPTSIKGLLKESKELSFFLLPKDRYKEFHHEAKKYGVLYHVFRKKGSDAYEIVVPNSLGAGQINRVLEKMHLLHLQEDVRVEPEPPKEKENAEKPTPFKKRSRTQSQKKKPAPSAPASRNKESSSRSSDQESRKPIKDRIKDAKEQQAAMPGRKRQRQPER